MTWLSHHLLHTSEWSRRTSKGLSLYWPPRVSCSFFNWTPTAADEHPPLTPHPPICVWSVLHSLGWRFNTQPVLCDLDGTRVFIHGFNEGVHALVGTHEPISGHVGFPRQQAERQDVQRVNAATLLWPLFMCLLVYQFKQFPSIIKADRHHLWPLAWKNLLYWPPACALRTCWRYFEIPGNVII